VRRVGRPPPSLLLPVPMFLLYTPGLLRLGWRPRPGEGVQGLDGVRVEDFRFRVDVFRFRVDGFGFRALG